ncbi:MAG TPA: hypothetical protein VGC80_13220 [Acetobacteraceae bacterium]
MVAAFAPGQAVAQHPANVTPGPYHCVFFINGSLTTTPGFTILPGGAYRHQDGSTGRFAYDAGQQLITFSGGSLDKQAGLVADNAKNGVIRIYNERRSRTVMDCDTPR